ncbi:hypothetical protein EPN42_13065 [bacterium]|nr:MAG: hypothetical protein EPN42_13065 [bacterium]
MIILLLVVAALVLGSIAATAAAPTFVAMLASGHTQNQFAFMTGMATAVHNYQIDHAGSFPSSTFFQQPSAYAPTIPVDPLDPTNATAFTVTIYTNSYGDQGYVITDAVPHPSHTLDGLPQYPGPGVPPAAKCQDNCTKIVYDPTFGTMGQ